MLQVLIEQPFVILLLSNRIMVLDKGTIAEFDTPKNLLKNKELLFKDNTIEFGCMSRKDGQTLLITFYITP